MADVALDAVEQTAAARTQQEHGHDCDVVGHRVRSVRDDLSPADRRPRGDEHRSLDQGGGIQPVLFRPRVHVLHGHFPKEPLHHKAALSQADRYSAQRLVNVHVAMRLVPHGVAPREDPVHLAEIERLRAVYLHAELLVRVDELLHLSKRRSLRRHALVLGFAADHEELRARCPRPVRVYQRETPLAVFAYFQAKDLAFAQDFGDRAERDDGFGAAALLLDARVREKLVRRPRKESAFCAEIQRVSSSAATRQPDQVSVHGHEILDRPASCSGRLKLDHGDLGIDLVELLA